MEYSMNRYFQILGVLFAVAALIFVACSDDDDPTEPPPPEPCTNCTVTVVPELDVTLYEHPTGQLANGRGTSLLTGATTGASSEVRRAAVKFPVAGAIPAGATIDSVRVFLTSTDGTPGGGPRITSLHRATTSWGEGASNASNELAGTQALTDDATWVHRFYDTSNWIAPGGDYIATASAGVVVNETSNFRYQWGTTDSLVANVQMWLDDTNTNHGWIIIGDEDPTARGTANLSPNLDNTLFEDQNGTWSNGKGEHVFVGRTGPNAGNLIRRTVISFDVRASGLVPTDATIDSVFLSMTLDRTTTQAGSQTIDVRLVLNPWGEGTSDAIDTEGAADSSTTDDATWIHTFFDQTFWTNPGGDFAGNISSSLVVNQEQRYTWPNTARMTSDVQLFLDTPALNYGWILIGNEADTMTAKRFASRENGLPANRPQLRVHYTAAVGSVKMFGSQQNPSTERRPSLQIFYTAP